MLSMTRSYTNLDENLNTQFDFHISIDAHFTLPAEKEFLRWKDESDRGMHDHYKNIHIAEYVKGKDLRRMCHMEF